MVKTYTRYVPRERWGVIASRGVRGKYTWDGKGIITGSLDEVAVWSVASGELVSSCFLFCEFLLLKIRIFFSSFQIANFADESNPGNVTSIALSPDGTHIAAGYERGMVKIWNFHTKQCKVSLSGHKSSVSCLSFNSSSSILVSGSLDTHLVVWDVLAERGVARLKGHKTRITQCAIVESEERGSFVVSSSLDGMLKVWNLDIYQVFPSFLLSIFTFVLTLFFVSSFYSVHKLLLATEEKFGIL